MRFQYFLWAVLLLASSYSAMAAQSPTAPPPARKGETASGATFTIPRDWSYERVLFKGLVRPPEADSRIGIIDVGDAPDALTAATAAWALFRSDESRHVTLTTLQAPHDGWDEMLRLEYEHRPSAHEEVYAVAFRRSRHWTVAILEGSESTIEKRQAAVNLIFESLRPEGYERESFAHRPAHALSPDRVATLKTFVQGSMKALGIPGTALAFVDHGQVIFEGGLGVRELGKPETVDAQTLFMIGSNTKSLTTLLLARLVDEGKLHWDDAVAPLFPAFKLGTPEWTRRVRMRHLVCACTGLPRQDFEWMLNTRQDTSASTTFTLLSHSIPTSRFGEIFQYNNLMAAAAGYIAGHLARPELELGAAYDAAMQWSVFEPLGMNDTTFDTERVLMGNHASPHGDDIDARPFASSIALDRTIFPYRPAGGAWSSAHDLARLVALELKLGVLPSGGRLVSERNLLVRREPTVSVGEDRDYGMGLMVDRTSGVPVFHHGGSLAGFQTDFIFVPDAQVGAVLLTNADDGEYLLKPFIRRLLEVLYDGRAEAETAVAAAAIRNRAEIIAARKGLAFPPTSQIKNRLAKHYANDVLGQLRLRSGDQVVLDFGAWSTRVASRSNDDGSASLITLDPTYDAFEFVIGGRDGQRTLSTNDGQHEYTYREVP